jgi:hypothetical protein
MLGVGTNDAHNDISVAAATVVAESQLRARQLQVLQPWQ